MTTTPLLILVVDDDVRTAQRLARMLRDEGYDVEVVGDGAAAIGRLSRDPTPHVLVTDLRMPHADGLAVSKYARAQRPGIPIFVVTSYPNRMGEMQRTFDPPPLLFTKPFDYDELSGEIGRASSRLAESR